MALMRFGTRAAYSRVARAACLMGLLVAPFCRAAAANLVFIRPAHGASREQETLETAAKFYGLHLDAISADDEASLRAAAVRTDVVAVAIAADALNINNVSILRRLFAEKQSARRPILILGLNEQTDAAAITDWTGEAVSGCMQFGATARSQYVFGLDDGVAAQLKGIGVASVEKDASYLVLGKSSAVESILNLRDGDRIAPVFVKLPRSETFVSCAVRTKEPLPGDEAIVTAFLRAAPAMMFVKYSGGASIWRAPGHYANFTIDDPWLREPYGYVDYAGLLKEMDRHNFHTTIAFIPWNYARSQTEVVSLFRNRPDRLSISIHGDNHDHKEFTDYRSRPLALQVQALEQSLARMEQFNSLTGIPYDKVMVFPHSIAPLATLDGLKRADYWATVNEDNVPQGGVAPASPGFALRPVTLDFAGFPSISRHSIAGSVSPEFVAINAYLDDPMFFYGHSDDLAKGISAFNTVADDVNRLQPDTRWSSLGDIVKHLYLQRVHGDSGYDLLALSNNICVENTTQREATYYVQTPDIGKDAPYEVLTDGQQSPFEIKNQSVNFALVVPKGSSRCFVIRYGKDLDLSAVVATHDSALAYLLRMSSDFRDIYLSKSKVGFVFIRFYYQSEIAPSAVIGTALALLLICGAGVYGLSRLVKSKRQDSGSGPQSFSTWSNSKQRKVSL